MGYDPHQIIIVPSCVPHTLDDIYTAKDYAERMGAHELHVDINDGIFASPITWPYTAPGVVGEIPNEITDGSLFTAHLMVRDPATVGERLIRSGIKKFVIHVESFENTDTLKTTLEHWRTLGAKPIGIATCLDTDIQKIFDAGVNGNYLMVMGVETLGAQGAEFDSRAVWRVEALHRIFPGAPIMVDGGVSTTTMPWLMAQGARGFVVGSALSHAENPKEMYAYLHSVAQNALQ
jgi:pentose-5-phosphate-3-epimerase